MTQAQAQSLLTLVTTQNNYLVVVLGILACIVGLKVLSWLVRW